MKKVQPKKHNRAIKDIMKPEQMARRSLKIEDQGVTIEDPQELAELFNVFFPEKIEKLRAKIIKQNGIEPLSKLRHKVNGRNLHFEQK